MAKSYHGWADGLKTVEEPAVGHHPDWSAAALRMREYQAFTRGWWRGLLFGLALGAIVVLPVVL